MKVPPMESETYLPTISSLDAVNVTRGSSDMSSLTVEDCFAFLSSGASLQNDTDLLNNVTNCTQLLKDMRLLHRPYALPLWQQVSWGVAFGLMVTVAAGGNAIVIWIVMAHRRMRTVTNYFLFNLSVADLLMATFNAIFNFVYMLDSHWPFGDSYCTLSNFVGNLTVASSVFTISAMSVDRYMAVVHPLKPRMAKKTALLVIVIIWVCGGMLSLPTLLYSATGVLKYVDGGNRTLCFLRWKDGPSGVSSLEYTYNIIFLLMTYLVPMLFMAVTYTWMGHVLWGSKGIGEVTELQMESIRSKQKIVRMLIVVVLIFAICWLPYHIYFLYTYHDTVFLTSDYVQHVYLAMYWMAMSNSMYNPIIYCWMNGRFRAYFQSVLCCCCVKISRPIHSSIRNQWSSMGKSLRLSTRKPLMTQTSCTPSFTNNSTKKTQFKTFNNQAKKENGSVDVAAEDV